MTYQHLHHACGHAYTLKLAEHAAGNRSDVLLYDVQCTGNHVEWVAYFVTHVAAARVTTGQSKKQAQRERKSKPHGEWLVHSTVQRTGEAGTHPMICATHDPVHTA